MKTKGIIFLAISAIITLSFTFASVTRSAKNPKEVVSSKEISNEPAGGFVSEDKF